MDKYRTIRARRQGAGLLSGYKWTGRRQDWRIIHAQLAIYYADRMPG